MSFSPTATALPEPAYRLLPVINLELKCLYNCYFLLKFGDDIDRFPIDSKFSAYVVVPVFSVWPQKNRKSVKICKYT
jgi:hypothetical protein